MEDNEPRLGSRAARRVPFRAAIQARRGESRYAVEIEDMSTSGAKLKSSKTLAAGTVLWLRLPGLEPMQGRVMWAEGFQCGCKFDQPLHPAVFESILNQHAPRSNSEALSTLIRVAA